MAENHETKSESEQTKNALRKMMAELWRIQEETDNLMTHMWRALHTLGHELEEMDGWGTGDE